MDSYTLGFIHGVLGIGVVWIIKEVLYYIKNLKTELHEYQVDEINEVNNNGSSR